MISNQTELKLNWLTVGPVPTYSSETWIPNESMKQTSKLLVRVFERSILRRIFGREKLINDLWRIKYNSQLNYLIKHRSIINDITSLRSG